MSELNKPTDSDVSKLNSEINQYINQRLIVTTTAITIFGVSIGWIVYGSSTPTGIEVKPITLLIPIILMILLFTMFLYCQVILGNIRIISVYLRATKKSNWEIAYQDYEKMFPYFTQDTMFSIIFGVLGISIAAIVGIIWLCFPSQNDVSFFAGIFATLCFIYLIVIYLTYRKKILNFGTDDHIYRNWKQLFLQTKKENSNSDSTSAQEICTQTIRNLPPTERLKLATLILNELVRQPSSEIEESETWAEQDQNDLLNFSLQYATKALSDVEEIEA